MARIGLGKILAGVAAAGAAGAAWFYFREKSIETPDHETVDSDGPFEILQARLLIESSIAEEAARRATPASIARISAAFSATEGASGSPATGGAPPSSPATPTDAAPSTYTFISGQRRGLA